MEKFEVRMHKIDTLGIRERIHKYGDDILQEAKRDRINLKMRKKYLFFRTLAEVDKWVWKQIT